MSVSALTSLIVAVTGALTAALALYHAVTAKSQVKQLGQQSSPGGPPSSAGPQR